MVTHNTLATENTFRRSPALLVFRRLSFLPPAIFIVINTVLLFLLRSRWLHVDSAIRLLYDINTLAFPALLLSIALLRVVHRGATRRQALPWTLPALLLIALRVYATHIEPHSLQLREVTIHSAKISRPFTVLHISDIQSGGIGVYEEEVVRRIQAINPDLILHTGDLLQPLGTLTRKSELPKLSALLSTLHPPLGMFTVEGESDTTVVQTPPEMLGGMQFLNTESVAIQADTLQIRLLGLSLRDSFKRDAVPLAFIEKWLAACPEDAITIVMGHRPDYIVPVLDEPIDLCLAGHTHGGQVRLPFIGALTTASGAPRKWSRGFYEAGKTRINVSAGIGASHNKGLPSIRFNCPPEMTLIRFEPTDKR